MNKISYGKQNIDEEDINAVIESLKSPWLTQGPKIEEFEQKIAEYHNCKYAVAFSNGTAALHACYRVTGIKPGEEFITTPITFAASANAGLYCGAIPKFVDIDSKTYNINIDMIEKNITDKTKVITPVSYSGYPVDLSKVRKIADKYNIKVIHDAAHAIGAKLNNEDIVKNADMTILSFHPVKHLCTGEGGMVLTNNEKYYEKLKIFRSHGITKAPEYLNHSDGPWDYDMIELGFNYRITDIQCALGISQLNKLDWSLYRRNQIAKKYYNDLKGIEWLTLPPQFEMNLNSQKEFKGSKNINSYHLFPILIKDKNKRLNFFNYLHENNILVQVHYIPVHTLDYYQKTFGYKIGDYPVSEDFYGREISIPMFPTLTNEEQDYIIKIIEEYNFE